MKFGFEIKTEPTLHTAVVTAVVVTSSSAPAKIAVSLANQSVATYCVTVLALIIWIAVTKTSPWKKKWILILPVRWLSLARLPRPVQGFFNSPLSPGTSAT